MMHVFLFAYVSGFILSCSYQRCRERQGLKPKTKWVGINSERIRGHKEL